MMDENTITFDTNKNTITCNGMSLLVFGTCTVKEGRLFMPLRNWVNIRTAYGYTVLLGIPKQATVNVSETTIVQTSKFKDPVFTGEGKPPNLYHAIDRKI